MPLDPHMRRILEAIPESAGMDVAHLPLAEALARLRTPPVPPGAGDIFVPTRDMTIDGPHGEIPIRIYRPAAATGVLVHYHGGGWVLGSIAHDEAYCQALAHHAQCVVVSVDYRLAPEFRYPVPLDDSYRALEWVLDNVAGLAGGGAPVAVGGTSAGANLAAAVALRALDRGRPQLAFQLLVYPVVDRSCRMPSYDEFATGHFLSADAMRWFWKQYAGDAPAADPWLSPLDAPSLRGLPAALVITAECDPLRDEGEA